MEPTMRVADEVWIATAQLHFKNPEAEDFTAGQIVDQVLENNYFGSLRPGVSIHISQHCVADKPANPGNYRMLASSPQTNGSQTNGSNRRLFRRGDKVGSRRENGKRVPYLSQIPSEHQQEVKRLLEWWSGQDKGYAFDPGTNPEEGTTPVKVRLNQIRLSEDIYPFFSEHPELGSIENIRDLEIAQYDSDGNPIDRYKNRQTSIKVGYALEIIAEHGLLESFEDILSDTGRSIKNTYRSWYQENGNQLRYPVRAREDIRDPESLSVAPFRRSPYFRRSRSEDPAPRRPSFRLPSLFKFPPEPGAAGIHEPGTSVGPVSGNLIHLENDIRPFLELYSPENAQLTDGDTQIPVSELDENGHRTDYYRERTVTIRVGYILTVIRGLGLIGEFENLLEETGRTINPRYERLYQQNMSTISVSPDP